MHHKLFQSINESTEEQHKIHI